MTTYAEQFAVASHDDATVKIRLSTLSQLLDALRGTAFLHPNSLDRIAADAIRQVKEKNDVSV